MIFSHLTDSFYQCLLFISSNVVATGEALVIRCFQNCVLFCLESKCWEHLFWWFVSIDPVLLVTCQDSKQMNQKLFGNNNPSTLDYRSHPDLTIFRILINVTREIGWTLPKSKHFFKGVYDSIWWTHQMEGCRGGGI